jgi:hypothetical protein
MEVVDVPQNQPVITGIRSHYRMGEMIRGNCSSQFSRPASNLTWLMNDQPVSRFELNTSRTQLLNQFILSFSIRLFVFLSE